MNNRTLIKLSAYEDAIAIRTISRNNHARHRFYISKAEWKVLESDRKLIVKDLESFAVLHYFDPKDEKEYVSMVIYWLQSDSDDNMDGWKETVCLPYDAIRKLIAGECEEIKVLSIQERTFPKLEFHSSKNLKAVVTNPIVRKKFSRFVRDHFNWPSSKIIMIYDDFIPYSFGFREESKSGWSINGGIILHGQDNMKQASYSMHT